MSTLTAKGSSTRDKILREARKQMVELGYNGLVLREVAQSCDIKLGNLQYYFPTVETLVLAVIEAERQRDIRLVNAAKETRKSPEAAIREIVSELVTRWRDDSSAIYATLNLLSLHHKSYKDLYNAIYDDHYKALESLIADAVPELSKAECARRSRLVTALIDGSAYQTKVGAKTSFIKSVIATATSLALAPAEPTH